MTYIQTTYVTADADGLLELQYEAILDYSLVMGRAIGRHQIIWRSNSVTI